MSIKSVWCGFAEGAVTDSHNTLTIVGFAPQSIAVETFPAALSPTLVFVAEEREEEGEPERLRAGSSADMMVSVTGPEDEAVFFVKQSIVIEPKRVLALPRRVMAISPVAFMATKSGYYTVTVTFVVPDTATEFSSSADLLVIEASAVAQQPS